MLKFSLRIPRARRVVPQTVHEQQTVGQLADRFAADHRYGPGDHTLAVDGRSLSREAIVGEVIYHKAKAELVLR